MNRPLSLTVWSTVSIVLGGLAALAFLSATMIVASKELDSSMAYTISVGLLGLGVCATGIVVRRGRGWARLPNCILSFVLFSLWGANFIYGIASLAWASIALFNKKSQEYFAGTSLVPDREASSLLESERD